MSTKTLLWRKPLYFVGYLFSLISLFIWTTNSNVNKKGEKRCTCSHWLKMRNKSAHENVVCQKKHGILCKINNFEELIIVIVVEVSLQRRSDSRNILWYTYRKQISHGCWLGRPKVQHVSNWSTRSWNRSVHRPRSKEDRQCRQSSVVCCVKGQNGGKSTSFGHKRRRL